MTPYSDGLFIKAKDDYNNGRLTENDFRAFHSDVENTSEG